MSTKTIAMLTILTGIGIMLASAVSVLFVFTRTITPVPLFDLPPLKLDPGMFMPSSLGGIAIPKGNTTPVELYPRESINFIANVSAHIFLAGFFVNVGFKLASLGIQLSASESADRHETKHPAVPAHSY